MPDSANHDEVCRLAINLARNCGYHVFPVLLTRDGKKVPTRPERDGGHGFHDASTDPVQIAFLWANWPGPLIGIRTGATSALDVVDVDPDHPEAWLWWEKNHHRIPPTRTYRSRRPGGFHLHFRPHRDGVGISRGSLPEGVDVRGEGGCCTFWFATGAECLDHSPPVPIPDWLLAAIRPKPQPAPRVFRRPPDPDKAIDGIVRKLAATGQGDRNKMLLWSACRLAEKGLTEASAEATLWPTCQSIGLKDIREVRATIRSAYRRAA